VIYFLTSSLGRGENHQSLTPKRTENYKRVIMDFIFRRDAIETSIEGDDLIDNVISIDIFKTVEQNIWSIFKELLPLISKPEPSQEAVTEAINQAVSAKVETIKEIKSAPWRFIGVAVSGNVKEKLQEAFAKNTPPEEIKNMFEELDSKSRIPAGHHVTLIHLSHKKAHLDSWNTLRQRTLKALDLNVTFTVTQVWSTPDVMFLPVNTISPAIACPNHDILHITVGTSSEEVKAKLSGDILEKVKAGEAVEGLTKCTLSESISFTGHIKGYC
jgi:tRNA ligase